MTDFYVTATVDHRKLYKGCRGSCPKSVLVIILKNYFKICFNSNYTTIKNLRSIIDLRTGNEWGCDDMAWGWSGGVKSHESGRDEKCVYIIAVYGTARPTRDGNR